MELMANIPTNVDKNKNKSVNQILKDILINWFLEASPHGLKNIFKSHNHVFMKIFWFLCFMGSSCYCVYAMNQIFLTYYKRSTYMSISRVMESPANFPQVSFCNNKYMNMTAFGPLLNEFNSSLFVSDDYENLTTYMKILKQQYKLRLLFNNNNDTLFQIFYDNSWWIKDMLVSCYFNNKKCTINDFITFFDPYYGWCFSFNSNITVNKTFKTTSLPGVLNGLSLELFLGI